MMKTLKLIDLSKRIRIITRLILLILMGLMKKMDLRLEESSSRTWIRSLTLLYLKTLECHRSGDKKRV
jgi:hypothetical protein